MKPWALLLAGLGAWAGEPSPFTLAATAELLYRHNLLATGPAAPAPRPDQFQHALSLAGGLGPWTGALTLREVNFDQQDANHTLDHPGATLYKRYLKYDSGRWKLQAGDFNAMLGRGMILSVIQNPAILKEDTIDGGAARFRSGRLELYALGGGVTTEKGDQSWRVAALEMTVEGLAGQRVGLRACTVQDGRLPRFGLPVGLRQCRSASLSGQDLFGSVSYYAELGHIDYRDQRPQPFSPVDPRKGDGAYGSLSWHRRGAFVMAEFKHYEHFDNALNTPPLADRETEKNRLDDSSGRRVYAQYSLGAPDLTLFGSAGSYREGPSEGHNLYGGFKLQDAFERLDLTWTYGLRTVAYLEKRGEAALTWRFTPRWSLDLSLRDKRNRPPGSAPYSESDLMVQLARSPRCSVYLLQQRSTAPAFEATRLYNGGARVNFRKGSYLDLSAGRLRGGEVCAGGQCITLPPFSGWKIAAHACW